MSSPTTPLSRSYWCTSKTLLITLTTTACGLSVAAAVGLARVIYEVVNAIGLVITFGGVLIAINNGERPANTDSRIAVDPGVSYAGTKSYSSAYEGITHERKSLNTYTMGNFSYLQVTTEHVEFDEEKDRFVVDPDDKETYSFPTWVSKSDWDSLYDDPDSAKPLRNFNPFDDPWERGGYWITTGQSMKYVFHGATVYSNLINPDQPGGAVDGELLDATQQKAYTYTARIHYERQALTWVAVEGGGYWKEGPWEYRSNDWNDVPGWKNAEKSYTGICPRHHKIRNISVSGGLDIWWHENYWEDRVTVREQPLDEQGNPKGDPIYHENILRQNTKWVPRFNVTKP